MGGAVFFVVTSIMLPIMQMKRLCAVNIRRIPNDPQHHA
jgi:hypothetical protein